MAIITPTVDALDERTVMLQIRKIAGTVDSNLEAVNDEMANIQEQIDQMEDVSSKVTALENEMNTVQSDLTIIESKNTEQDSAISENEKGLITASELTYSEGVLTLKLIKQNGDLTETVDVPFFKTVTLIPTSTERAFKLQFTMWDDSIYDTNEFVIPAGGGTDVSVTGVTIGEGASDNSFKVSIQLSDASTIASNDYPFPTSITNPYPTDVVLSLSGNTLSCDITLSDNNHVDGSVDLTNLLSVYATTEDLSDLQEQVTGLKLSKPTNNQIQLNGDSVNIIDSITGVVVGGNLKLTINGVTGSDIPLPESELEVMVKQIATYVTLSVESSTGYNRNFIRTYDVDNVNLSNEFPVFDENNHIIGKGQQKYGITNILHYEGNLTKYLPNSEIIKGIKSMFSFNIADGTYLTYIIFAQTNPGQSGYTQALITIENNEITSINTQNVYLPDSFSTGNVSVVINFCGLKKTS